MPTHIILLGAFRGRGRLPKGDSPEGNDRQETSGEEQPTLVNEITARIAAYEKRYNKRPELIYLSKEEIDQVQFEMGPITGYYGSTSHNMGDASEPRFHLYGIPVYQKDRDPLLEAAQEMVDNGQ